MYIQRLTKGKGIPNDLEFCLSSRCWNIPLAFLHNYGVEEKIAFRWYFTDAVPETVDGKIVSDSSSILSESPQQIVELLCQTDPSLTFYLVKNSHRLVDIERLLLELLRRLKGTLDKRESYTRPDIQLKYAYAKLCSRYAEGHRRLAEGIRELLNPHTVEDCASILALADSAVRWKTISLLLKNPTPLLILTIQQMTQMVDKTVSLPLEKAFSAISSYPTSALSALLDIAKWCRFKVDSEYLMDLLGSDDEDVVERAASLFLCLYPSRGAVDTLLEHIDEKSVVALRVLAPLFPQKACEVAERLLQSENEAYRYEAAYTLADLKPQRVLNLLKQSARRVPYSAFLNAFENAPTLEGCSVLVDIVCDGGIGRDYAIRAARVLADISESKKVLLRRRDTKRLLLLVKSADGDFGFTLYRILRANLKSIDDKTLKSLFDDRDILEHIRIYIASLLAYKGDPLASKYLWRKISRLLPEKVIIPEEPFTEGKNFYGWKIQSGVTLKASPSDSIVTTLWELNHTMMLPFGITGNIKDLICQSHKASYLSLFLYIRLKESLESLKGALQRKSDVKYLVSQYTYQDVKAVIDDSSKEHPLVLQLIEEIATSNGGSIDYVWLWLDLKRRASLSLRGERKR